jgi:hypothetical protein
LRAVGTDEQVSFDLAVADGIRVHDLVHVLEPVYCHAGMVMFVRECGTQGEIDGFPRGE